MTHARVLGAVQPSYLAWIPFFQRMLVSDVFVHLDDVEYSKNSFHNRNRIKTPSGPLTLTVPVLYRGNSKTHIKDIPVNNQTRWQRKHWLAIAQSYAHAPHFGTFSELLRQRVYERRWEYLGDLNVEIIECIREYLGIPTPCVRSSDYGLEQGGNDKLAKLCDILGANTFVVKPGTEHYHPQEFFLAKGIGFRHFSTQSVTYPQLHGAFAPGLSALDFAMNMGPDSYKALLTS